MRKFIITEEQREEVMRLYKAHSYIGARNVLISLPEVRDDTPLEENKASKANTTGKS